MIARREPDDRAPVGAPLVRTWTSGGGPLVVARGEVHVWRASLELGDADRDRLAATLGPAERERAGTFCDRPDRDRFVARRGVLRDLLGRYLGARPETLVLAAEANGRPVLAGGDPPGFSFNLSHSVGLALFAVSGGARVGVDVERIRPDPADGDVARAWFSPRDRDRLGALPSTAWPDAFFRCWTRREALGKAAGFGLGGLLGGIDLLDDRPGGASEVTLPEDPPRRFALYSLDPAPGFAAAVAVEVGNG